MWYTANACHLIGWRLTKTVSPKQAAKKRKSNLFGTADGGPVFIHRFDSRRRSPMRQSSMCEKIPAGPKRTGFGVALHTANVAAELCRRNVVPIRIIFIHLC